MPFGVRKVATCRRYPVMFHPSGKQPGADAPARRVGQRSLLRQQDTFEWVGIGLGADGRRKRTFPLAIKK